MVYKSKHLALEAGDAVLEALTRFTNAEECFRGKERRAEDF